MRLTIDLSPGLSGELDEVAARTGRSKAELVGIAIDLLLQSCRAEAAGKLVGVIEEEMIDGVRERIIERFYLPR